MGARYKQHKASVAHDPNDPVLFKQLSSELAELMSKFLTENHGFAAFGGGITTTGEIVYLANGDEGADPQEELQRLAKELASPKWQTGIIFVDTRVTPPGEGAKSDAVWMISESRTGFVSHDFLPYAIKDGSVVYGKSFKLPNPRPLIYVRR